MCLCVYWFRNVRLCVCVGVYVCVLYYMGVCMHGFVMCVCVCVCVCVNFVMCGCVNASVFLMCCCVYVWFL